MGFEAAVHPLPPGEVLEVAVVAHRYEGHLREESSAACCLAADTSAARERELRQPVAAGTEVPAREPKSRDRSGIRSGRRVRGYLPDAEVRRKPEVGDPERARSSRHSSTANSCTSTSRESPPESSRLYQWSRPAVISETPSGRHDHRADPETVRLAARAVPVP